MTVKTVFFLGLSYILIACSDAKPKYRDTTDLEIPPRLVITERPSGTGKDEVQKDLKEYVFLDDVENPPILKIKKLFDRSWNLVGQALDKKKIEITDKNRDQGVYFVKYDPSADLGKVFGNVKLFFFEEEYGEAEYKLSIAWHETETEVRAVLIAQQETSFDDEDDEELGDASAKLIKTLYDTINDELTE